MGKRKLTWSETTFTWSENPFIWSDVALIQEALGNAKLPPEMFDEWLNKHPEKKLRLIQLKCIIQGIEYKQEKRQSKKRKIKVEDIYIIAEVFNKVNKSIKIEFNNTEK